MLRKDIDISRKSAAITKGVIAAFFIAQKRSRKLKNILLSKEEFEQKKAESKDRRKIEDDFIEKHKHDSDESLLERVISVKIFLTPTAKKEEVINGKVLLSNKTFLPITKVICFLETKNNLTGEEEIVTVIASSAPEKVSETEFCISSSNCGYITIKAKKIYVTDIFGFIPIRVTEYGMEKGKTTVLPNTFDSVIVFDSIPPIPEDSESYSPDKKGYDYSETFQIREYVEGDNIKQIHWKLSEKIDKMIIREASLPIAKSTLLFWDKTAGDEVAPQEMDAMAEIVASVGENFCRSGMEFALGWGDGKASFIEEIKSTTDFIEIIPRIIKYGTEKEAGYCESFFKNGDFPVFSKTICIAKTLPEGIENLYGKSSVNLILCDKNISGDNIINFSPESYIEDLKMLEFTT